MSHRIVGKPVPRVEGEEKVTGMTRYAADLSLPGSLHGKVLRSSVPHARLVRVDTSKAMRLPGVHAVLAGQDLPPLLIGQRMKDMPVLARERVRYVGEPVAAVAADSIEAAEEALTLIQVDYEELPAVFDPLAAIQTGAPIIHENPSAYKNAPPRTAGLPNLQSLTIWKNGDLERELRRSHRIFEHTFRTPLTHHGYLEPHGCTVGIGPSGKVEIWASNKAPYNLRDRLAVDLAIPQEQIKVHILPVGGDFGGKSSVIDVPLCYFLAERARRPVKMVLTYPEELAAGSHRHPAVVTIRTGVEQDGTLCAVEAKIVFSGGAYAAYKANPEVTVLGPRRLASYYRIPAIHIETYCAYTNQVPCTQTRTPGSPQTVFAMESQMDIIAQELGLDPVELRMRNLLKDGDVSPLGYKWQEIRARETLRKAVEASGWKATKRKEHCGKGVALYERGAAGGKSSAAITIDQMGQIEVLTGVPDVGPGIHTIIQQIVSEALKTRPDCIQVRVRDTDSLPFDPGTGGSKTTNTSGHAALKAANEILPKLVFLASRQLGCSPDEIRQEKGAFAGPKQRRLTFNELARLAASENNGPVSYLSVYEPSQEAPVTSFAAQIAEVQVDPETGQITVKKITTVHDAGTVLNSLTYQGQIDGGVMMGLGFALMEETPLAEGRVATANLGDFKIPCIKETPPLTTVLLRSSIGPVPYQGKAIGELPNVPTAAAIANAVADAVGVRIFELPLTAEKVYKGLSNWK